MKKILLVALLVLLAVTMFAVKGPLPDKIYINAKTSEEIGIRDAAEGITDIFYWGVSGPTLFGLDPAIRENLDVYSIPSGSWSLIFNPIPNEAPYTWTIEDKEHFNPFAIREVRFAMNFIINRQYIVDEILGGAGNPAFTMATSGQPGTYRYNLLVDQFGMTPEGDEAKAIADITAAMEKAAELPNNKGRLEKKADGFWYFDGEKISIKFLIRVDDPNGRLLEGHYVADQIEKAGIAVERLEWDRSRTGTAVYGGDPANLEWHLYTEGWGAGATRRWWEHIVAQMYSPWYGYMPGGQNADYWNYENPEIDKLTQDAYSGNFLLDEEYWDYTLRGAEIGLKEAVRIYVINQFDFFVANKDRFNSRFAYGMGDGVNKWTLVTADVPDKVLRITEFSAQGSLFMKAWDPVGDDGLSDVYGGYVMGPIGSRATFESPASAEDVPDRVSWANVQSKVSKDEEGNLVGELKVPPFAVYYDSATKMWRPAGAKLTSFSSADYSYKFSNYHDGTPQRFSDILHSIAFIEEWINKDTEDDPYYDSAYDATQRPLQFTKGVVFNANGTLTAYFDYNFPADSNRVGARGAQWIGVSAGQPSTIFAWHIIEAVGELVATGSKSGTVYTFAPGTADTEVDLLVPSCVADIKAKLEEFVETKHIPVSIKDYMTEEDAIEAYQNAIAFIDEHGHAAISDGPFYMHKYDPTTNFIELRAFRDETYPYDSEYWVEFFKTPILNVEKIDVPAIGIRGTAIPVKVRVSETIYPDNKSMPAGQGSVIVTLITPDAEYAFDAAMTTDGMFEVVIPGEATANLEGGSYVIMAIASLEGGVPASGSQTVVIY